MAGIKEGVLQDFLIMDLMDLSERVTLSESGGVLAFKAEAEALAAAMAKAYIRPGRIKNPNARSLFLMRCFYLLGVLRGGEAARSVLLGDDGVDNVPPVLSEPCARLFVNELEGLDSLSLAAICRNLGL